MFIYSIGTGLVAISLAGIFVRKITAREISSRKMEEIAGYIKTGAYAYLQRQTKTILLLMPFLFLFLWLILGWRVAITSVLGVLTSLAAAYVGMSICVRANLQTADSAAKSITDSFLIAVRGGAVMGFCVTGFSLIILSTLFLIFNDPETLIGFGFGASLAALFAQIGGGIFTKSADIGADLVGKIEKNIPEDDPRNAAVIADLVGDNVGDCAGRGADLFQTFSDDIVTGTIVATAFVYKFGPKVIFLPILLQSVGVVCSLIGIFLTRSWKKEMKPASIFNFGLYSTAVLCAIGTLVLTRTLLNNLSLWFASILGIATTLVAATTTKHYAGMEGSKVPLIAEASKRGPALNMITALSFGLRSPIASIVMIISSIIFSFQISGGLLLAIVVVNISTDLLIGYIMAADSFGPIVDNAAGIAQMSQSPKEVSNSLSILDSVGNTMKAITKAYAMSSGTVTAFVIFATFFTMTKITSFNLTTPYNLGFLFLGTSLPYLISSITIGSTAKTAQLIVDEVRKQFREIKGLIEGKANPDYSRCVDIATSNALKEMVLPGIISIFVPIFVGLTFGAMALGCLLIGAVASSALLGPFFNNLGTSLDNAKKLIENDEDQVSSFAHAAAVVGDTVGDPLKDVAGPSLLIFMKLIGMSALLIAPLLK